MNTPTPKTDAFWKLPYSGIPFIIEVEKYCKELERELTAANDNLALTQGQLKGSREMLAAANSKIAELKGLFEKYSRHTNECRTAKFLGNWGCTCDYDATLKKVREM